jgi:hypothetical protein
MNDPCSAGMLEGCWRGEDCVCYLAIEEALAGLAAAGLRSRAAARTGHTTGGRRSGGSQWRLTGGFGFRSIRSGAESGEEELRGCCGRRQASGNVHDGAGT